MEIVKNKNGEGLEVLLKGRLDTTTAPSLEEALKGELDGINGLTLDCKELEYISSAGLRVLLGTHKAMKDNGGLVITNVCEDIMEVFEITGFSDILTIK